MTNVFVLAIFFFGEIKTPTDDVWSNLTTVYGEIEKCNLYLNPNNGSYLCQANVDRDIRSFRGCRCDSYCHQVGDCCMDKQDEDEGRYNASYGCFPYRVLAVNNYHLHVLTVDSCESTWPRDRLRHLCEDKFDPETEDLDEFTYTVPARSNATGVYYKNIFCAICNRDDADLTTWNLEYSSYHCDGNAIGNLTFNDMDGNWASGNCDFRIPNLWIYPYRPCVIDNSEAYVSNCSDSSSPYASFCQQYFAPVVVRDPTDPWNSRYFKNYLCYLCNYVSLSPGQFLACGQALTPVFVGVAFDPYSLSILLNFNSPRLRNLKKVGSAKEDPPVCYSDQVYVKGLKKCMQLQCPGGEGGMIQVSRRHFTLLPNGTVLLVNGKMFSNRTLTYRDGEVQSLRVCSKILRNPNSKNCKTGKVCHVHFAKFEVGALVLRSNVSLEPREILDFEFDNNGVVDRVELCAEILKSLNVDCE